MTFDLLPSERRASELDKLCFVGREASRIPTRPRLDRPSIILPGLESGSAVEAKLKLSLFEKLSEKVPQSNVDETGLCDHRAVPDDWTKLKTAMPGFGMNPSTIPPVTTVPLRESLHLGDRVSPRDTAIAKRLAVLMTADRKSEGLKLSRDSSSSGIIYTKDPKLKRREAMFALINAQHISRLTQKERWRQLYDDYQTAIYHHIVYREQPDSWKGGQPKQRFVNKIEYALDPAGHPEARIPADRATPYGLARSRTRTAYASAGIPNRILSAVFQPYASYAYSEYSFTWKVRNEEELKERLKKFRFFIATDTTQHDQLYSSWVVDLLIEGLSHRLRDDLLSLLRRVFVAPVHLASPVIGEKKSIWLGDPFTSQELDIGLPSGLGPNSFIGRWWMTANILMWIDRLTGDVFERMDSCLRGQERIAVLNSADDMLVLFQSQADRDRLRDIWLTPLDHPCRRDYPNYMPLEIQTPVSFLGMIPYRDTRGELHVTRNICSYVVNRLCPEWPITSRKRSSFWAVGLEETRRLFADAPMFSEVYSLLDAELLAHVGQSLRSMEAEFAPIQRALLSGLRLNSADREVLMNSDKLFYKFDESDISPDIWNSLMLGLPGETTFKFIKPYLL